MKTLILRSTLVAALFLCSTFAWAQSDCTPDLTLSAPGLYPLDVDSVPCAEQGVAYSHTWQFKNYQVAPIGNAAFDWIQFDSILNLPCGIGWSTSNHPNHRFTPSEAGCIEIGGTTSDAVGDYKIIMVLSVKLPTGQILEGITSDILPPDKSLPAFVQVVAASAPCTPIDTGSANATASCYTGEANLASTGIYDQLDDIANINIQPNPVQTYADITFTAEEQGIYQIRILDLTGKEAYAESREVSFGENTIRFDRNGLPSGTYLFTINSGKASVAKKFVIAE